MERAGRYAQVGGDHFPRYRLASLIDRRAFVLTAAAAATLLAARRVASAQATSMPRVTLLDRGGDPSQMTEKGHPYWGALLSELRRLGYVEGETILIDRLSGSGQTPAQFAKLAQLVVEAQPDLVVTRGSQSVLNLIAATRSIPILTVGTFPTEVYATHSQPGGNVTGIEATAGGLVHAKRLQLLHDAVPSASRFAVVGPRDWWAKYGEIVQDAAMQLGLTLVLVFVDEPVSEMTIRNAVTSLSGRNIDAVYIGSAINMFAHNAFISEQMAEARLPAVSLQLEYARAGLLLCYAPDYADWYRRLAVYVDRILKGANPKEMPIQQASEIKLVINLATARTLGITIPPKLLIQATELIE